jgi:hypothetical protein
MMMIGHGIPRANPTLDRVSAHGLKPLARCRSLARLHPHRLACGVEFRDASRFAFGTSLSGVFAVGDVRAGAAQRVASAVGEGSVAIRDVHEYLAALRGS